MRQCLEIPDRLTELNPFGRVLHREIDHGLRSAAVPCSGHHPFELEARKHVAPALIYFTDQAISGDAHIVEKYFIRADRAPPQGIKLAQFQARRRIVDQE